MIGSKESDTWSWGRVGVIVGTDSAGVESAVDVYECPLCHALVASPCTGKHQEWHHRLPPWWVEE